MKILLTLILIFSSTAYPNDRYVKYDKCFEEVIATETRVKKELHALSKRHFEIIDNAVAVRKKVKDGFLRYKIAGTMASSLTMWNLYSKQIFSSLSGMNIASIRCNPNIAEIKKHSEQLKRTLGAIKQWDSKYNGELKKLLKEAATKKQ